MGKNVTIYDVAAHVGVSISTVSNALNRPERVNSATRERVLRAADELGFVPKHEAVSLARKDVGSIGVLAPFTSYPSYLTRMTGILRELAASGLDVMIFDIESAATAPSPVLAASAIRGRLDGLIVMGERIDSDVERRLIERGMPTVVVDAPSEVFNVVVTDEERGGGLAAAHLLGLGHRSIGYLVERQVADYESQAKQRLAGFSRQLDRLGGTELVVSATSASIDEARSVARELLSRPHRPTALMAHYDDLAIGALQAARDLGLRVPEDLSVMGYDDGPGAAAAGLSTVRQPFAESGAAAARVLRAAMAGLGPRTVTILDCTLIHRESTAAVPE